jgi:hypothetical protein
MSHQVKLQAQIKDKEVLEETLRELNYSFVHNEKLIDYYGKDLGTVDLIVKIGESTNKVGFLFDSVENTYNIVGDFYNTGITKESFRNSIKKTYVGKKLESLLQKKRYTVVEKSTKNNGAIKMLARTMVA